MYWNATVLQSPPSPLSHAPLHATDMGRKVGAAVSPHLTQCRPGRGLPPHQVASWSSQPFGHNRRWPKSGGGCYASFRGLLCTFRGGELGPILIQCRLGRGLPPYKVASWSSQPFGRNSHWPKSGRGLLCPFGGGAESPYNTMSPGPRPASIQPFDRNRHGPKIGEHRRVCVVFSNTRLTLYVVQW